MKFRNYLIILSTIMLGYWLDDSLNTISIKLFLELNFGFLIFAYWVFALPEKNSKLSCIDYGFGNRFIFFKCDLVLICFFFTATLHCSFVFRFRIFLISNYRFSFFRILYLLYCMQISLLSPNNYSYIVLFCCFLITLVLWVEFILL